MIHVIYVVYVRLLLEHNTVIWIPYKDIEATERVQRRFAKRLRGYGNFFFNCTAVYGSQALVIDLVYGYKIVFLVVDICMDAFFSFTHCT